MTLAYDYDISLPDYKTEHHAALQGTPLGEVALRIATHIGDVPELNSLRDSVLGSLVSEDDQGRTPELRLAAYRAIQLLATNGCAHLVKHMFAANTDTIIGTALPNVVKVSSLMEDEGSYQVLYERARALLSKSGYYNKFQSPMHENMDVAHTGIPNLLRTLALILLYMDVN